MNLKEYQQQYHKVLHRSSDEKEFLTHTFNCSLAKKYGVTSAIIINYFYSWISHNVRIGSNYIEGRTWMYETVNEITQRYSYLSRNQVQRVITKLVELKVLLKDKFNECFYDRVLWYSFAEEEKFLFINDKEEQKHYFECSLAKKYGVMCALLLNHFYYWISNNQKRGLNFLNKKTWFRQTVSKIAKSFPYYNPVSIQHAIDKLVELKVMAKHNFNKNTHKRILWYSFENEEVFEFLKKNEMRAKIQGKTYERTSANYEQGIEKPYEKINISLYDYRNPNILNDKYKESPCPDTPHEECNKLSHPSDDSCLNSHPTDSNSDNLSGFHENKDKEGVLDMKHDDLNPVDSDAINAEAGEEALDMDHNSINDVDSDAINAEEVVPDMKYGLTPLSIHMANSALKNIHASIPASISIPKPISKPKVTPETIYQSADSPKITYQSEDIPEPISDPVDNHETISDALLNLVDISDNVSESINKSLSKILPDLEPLYEPLDIPKRNDPIDSPQSISESTQSISIDDSNPIFTLIDTLEPNSTDNPDVEPTTVSIRNTLYKFTGKISSPSRRKADISKLKRCKDLDVDMNKLAPPGDLNSIMSKLNLYKNKQLGLDKPIPPANSVEKPINPIDQVDEIIPLPSRGDKPISPPNGGYKYIDPANQVDELLPLPNRGEEPISPPNRGEKLMSPPNRDEKLMSPPNRDYNDSSKNNKPKTNPMDDYKNRYKLKLKNKTKSKSKLMPTPTDEALKISCLLFEKLKERNPNRRNPNIQKWANDLDTLMRLDNRSIEQVKDLIDFVFHPDTDFWIEPISTAQNPMKSIRKNFDTIMYRLLNPSPGRSKELAIRRAEDQKQDKDDMIKENQNWCKSFDNIDFDVDKKVIVARKYEINININGRTVMVFGYDEIYFKEIIISKLDSWGINHGMSL